MQSIYVPKYDIHYRINPKNPCELQWSKKPFGPMTAWQKAFMFTKPIRALDIDDDTQQGVVVLNDSSTYVGSGVRVWGRKYYTAGSRLYSLYAIGESKMKKMTIKLHEKKGAVDLDAMMTEFKQALGSNYKLNARSESTNYGQQQLVVSVPGVGSFFCAYELVYNGGKFNVRTWEADSEFERDCDFDLYKKLQSIFYRYCDSKE